MWFMSEAKVTIKLLYVAQVCIGVISPAPHFQDFCGTYACSEVFPPPKVRDKGMAIEYTPFLRNFKKFTTSCKRLHMNPHLHKGN